MKFNLFGLTFSVAKIQTVKIPDFLQESEDVTQKIIPKGSDTIFFRVASFAYTVGAMHEHLRTFPKDMRNPMMIYQITKATKGWQDFDSKPLKEKEQNND